MLLEARILNNPSNTRKTNKVLIPKSAVLWTGKRSIVYIKIPDTKNAFKLQEVELGREWGDSYEINSGIQPGDEIVINGAFTLDAEAQLQGKASMMNRTSPKQNSSKSKEVMKCGTGKCGGM
jgi:Cu(I)/Ag(I) efflux system membrane fusion protein